MICKGHVSFGLVNIPVALHPAARRDELDFTLIDKRDLSPIGYRKVNKRTGQEVPGNRITRGLEQQKGRFVIVSDEDLRRASPERTRRIDILSFTDPRDVDPIYLRPSVLPGSEGPEEDVPEASEPKPAKGKGQVIDLVELLERSVERRGRAAAGKRRGSKVR